MFLSVRYLKFKDVDSRCRPWRLQQLSWVRHPFDIPCYLLPPVPKYPREPFDYEGCRLSLLQIPGGQVVVQCNVTHPSVNN